MTESYGTLDQFLRTLIEMGGPGPRRGRRPDRGRV